jgi:hypothetical protein
MADQEKIDGWKKQYKSVYKATFGENAYLFRGLTREDFLAISQKQLAEEGYDSELETVKTCVLEPTLDDDFLKNKPGLVTLLSEQIMQRSGFQQIEVEEI